ncbi:MAG: Uncharacterized protein LiPW41_147 [Parcubacteria group bacterium LiPW_41]|nr:MAG: Uncharacterized protein LiPW41_147 [Parcubacteria group bacterium LiPW_41]
MFNNKLLQEQLQKARRFAEESDAKRRAAQIGLHYLDIVSTRVPTELKAMQKISEISARKALLVPLHITKTKIVVAAFDPRLPEAHTIIESLKAEGFSVEIYVVSRLSLEHGWGYYKYVPEETKEISGKVDINEENLRIILGEVKTLKDLESHLANFSSPFISQMLEIILAGAMALKASDIHMEPVDETGILRLRIDGILHTVFDKFSLHVYKSVITRIKLLSNLKLNITNEPQDGRFTIGLSDRDIEVRTSIIPSEYGETVVMRILDPLSLKVNLEDLGWRKDDLIIVKETIDQPNGLILNTGPTGSGKTTTLYAFLKSVSTPEIKIITVEDPIEYHLDGVSQTQVNSNANYTFASGLRSILRQDPDVILIGEIRDKETAEIALESSLTGHLVFSTLHTNDAIGAIPRFLDLGAKPNILGPALSLIIAQRLVRVLCKKCKEEIPLSSGVLSGIDSFIKNLSSRVDKSLYTNPHMFSAKGCTECAGLGYKGRISIFELFVVNDAIRELIYKDPTEMDLFKSAKNQGMVTMQEDGFLKVLQGITTIEEVERATGTIQWLKEINK